MGYSGYVADDLVFQEWMRSAASDPAPPEPSLNAPPPPVTQTEVVPSPQAWKASAQIAKYSDGSENAQLLGKDAAKMRWGMAKAFATKLAPHNVDKKLAVLNEEIELEALDPKHRMGDLLRYMLSDYKKYTPPAFHSKLSLFFMWVDGFCRDEPEIALQTLVAYFGEANRPMCQDFVRAGVAYKEKAEERKPYLLTFMGGKLYRNGELFDTSKCETAHSGPGWAIYVVSPHGQWYAGSHRVGAFHHSTFLAGRPVLAAGEMQVSHGVVTLLTAKSGHYQPTMEQFVNGLKSLKRAGIPLDRCQVEVYEGRQKPVRIAAVPFMVNGHLQARHLVWG
jgi:hypothetical protein